MKWIGLTGGIGTGKSTVSALLRDLGQTVIDADEIARFVVQKGSPGLAAVVHAFGPEVLCLDGTLNRAALGTRVFQDEASRFTLESILHPLIRSEAQRRRSLSQAKGLQFAFYDIPLLFEKKMDKEFDATVVVVSSLEQQINRVQNRDHLSREEVERRLAAQLPLAEKIKRADYRIDNDSDLEHLKRAVRAFLDALS